jgi:CBS domain containing-hemolysin-like protein
MTDRLSPVAAALAAPTFAAPALAAAEPQGAPAGPEGSLSAVPLLIALNAFFVAAEYAVVALRPAQVEAMRAAGHRRTAEAIESLKSRPAEAIGTIQVCITMTNLLLGWVGEPAMSALLMSAFAPLAHLSPTVVAAVAVVISFVLVTLLTVVFSELLPKALTLKYATVAGRLTAVPVLGIRRAVQPLVWMMNHTADLVTRPLGLGSVKDLEESRVTADEIRHMATQAATEGALTPTESSIVQAALLMGRRRAKEVVVPRTRVAYLDLHWTMDRNRAVMNEHLYSRLPLCDGGLDHVVGVLHTKEFLTAYNADGDVSVLRLIARPPTFAPEQATLDNLLATFHEDKTQMVFLVDEHGGVEGIVTLKDVVDELVGEIQAR